MDTIIPRASYHNTLAHLPIYWSIRKQTLPTKIDRLDLKSHSVLQIYIEDKGLEVRGFRNTKTSTNHYTLMSENNGPLNIWLAVNGSNIPYFFQLQGKDEHAFFTVKLKP